MGIGYGRFDGTYPNYQAKYFEENSADLEMIHRADIVRYPYNILLQIFSEQGLIGLLNFILLLNLVFKRVKFSDSENDRSKKFILVCGFSCIIAVLVFGMFSYPFNILPVCIMFFMSLGFISGGNSNYRDKLEIQIKKKYNLIICRGLSCFLVISGLVLFNLTLKAQKYNERWNKVGYLGTNEMTALYPFLREDIDFVSAYSDMLYHEKRYKEVIKLTEASAHLVKDSWFYLNAGRSYAALGQNLSATKAFRTASHMYSNQLDDKYALFKFYLKTNKFKEAVILGNNMLHMFGQARSPIIDSIRADLQIYPKK